MSTVAASLNGFWEARPENTACAINKRVMPFDIAADVHDSLARMQVDHIELYLLHRDDPTQPVGPIVEALNEQSGAGRIGSSRRFRRPTGMRQVHRLRTIGQKSKSLSIPSG